MFRGKPFAGGSTLVALLHPPALDAGPEHAGEPGRCCLCGAITWRGLCQPCRLSHATPDPTTGRLLTPPWLLRLQALTRRATKVAVRAHTLGIALVPLDESLPKPTQAQYSDEGDELPPAPPLVVPDAALPLLRHYRNGVPLDMVDFVRVLDELLAWPPPGTTYDASHREALVDLYERVYPA